MGIFHVAAMAQNRVIGDGPHIPWRVRGEQKRFRALTTGHAVIFGRRTWESIGRPLPDRHVIVVSRTLATPPAGCELASDLPAAIALGKAHGPQVYIAGGGQLYRTSMPLVDGLHLTTIHIEVAGDVTYPEIPADFRLCLEEQIHSNIDYTYRYYERVKRFTGAAEGR